MIFQSKNKTFNEHVYALQGDLEQSPDVDLWPQIVSDLHALKTSPPKTKGRYIVVYAFLLAAFAAGIFYLTFDSSSTNKNEQYSDYYVLADLEQEYEIRKEILLKRYELSLEELQHWQDQIDHVDASRSAILDALKRDPDNLFLITMLEESYEKQLDIIEQIHLSKYRSP